MVTSCDQINATRLTNLVVRENLNCSQRTCNGIIAIVDEQRKQPINCSQDYSCSFSKFYLIHNHTIVNAYFGGNSSGNSSIFTVHSKAAYFDFFGFNSGYNTTIDCEDGSKCRIDCYNHNYSEQTSCKNLNINCNDCKSVEMRCYQNTIKHKTQSVICNQNIKYNNNTNKFKITNSTKHIMNQIGIYKRNHHQSYSHNNHSKSTQSGANIKYLQPSSFGYQYHRHILALNTTISQLETTTDNENEDDVTEEQVFIYFLIGVGSLIFVIIISVGLYFACVRFELYRKCSGDGNNDKKQENKDEKDDKFDTDNANPVASTSPEFSKDNNATPLPMRGNTDGNSNGPASGDIDGEEDTDLGDDDKGFVYINPMD